jgi:hypothetical protein
MEMSMRSVLTILISVAAMGLGSLSAAADAKKCKPGQEFDETKGKCVVIRGS